MQQRLLDANMHQTDQPLAEVLGLLTTLEEGWSGVARELSRTDDQPEEAQAHWNAASEHTRQELFV